MSLKFPAPYFGGKAPVAAEVWSRFGNVDNFIEPLCGSSAVLLGRPEHHCQDGHWPHEVLNDAYAQVANVLRALRFDPAATAAAADWPIVELDLYAWHVELNRRAPELERRLRKNPKYFEAETAGKWLWGASSNIGDNWCRPTPQFSIPRLACETGVHRKIPCLDHGKGVHRKYTSGLANWFSLLSARLRKVIVCCGDWRRVVTPCALGLSHDRDRVCGVFFDPPCGDEAGCDRVYTKGDGKVAPQVRAWCLKHGGDPRLKIALCGYADEGHESLERAGWSVFEWQTSGGYGNQAAPDENGAVNVNRKRERIWFSPACLPEPTLFGKGR